MVLEHGCPPFFFDWGGGTAIADTVPALLLLPVGTHSITVTDGRMEGDTISVTIVPAPAITATTATDVACPIGADPSIGGTASIQAIGGTGAFSFLWSNGDSTATVSDLPVGVYQVTITDANADCEKIPQARFKP